jgi:hypothetical protein
LADWAEIGNRIGKRFLILDAELEFKEKDFKRILKSKTKFKPSKNLKFGSRIQIKGFLKFKLKRFRFKSKDSNQGDFKNSWQGFGNSNEADLVQRI